MAVTGWLVDNSVAARRCDPTIGRQLELVAEPLHLCPVGQLEQLYSARSASDYDALLTLMVSRMRLVEAPADLFERALRLQRNLAHHHGLWHRIPIPDLLIAETALFHGLGVLHVNGDYDRIREVRPLVTRRLG